jgi:hypothetical protein
MGDTREHLVGALQSRVNELEIALAQLTEALHTRVSELEAALAPVAGLERAYPRHPGEFAIVDLAPHARITVGDARRAKTLLQDALSLAVEAAG